MINISDCAIKKLKELQLSHNIIILELESEKPIIRGTKVLPNDNYTPHEIDDSLQIFVNNQHLWDLRGLYINYESYSPF